MQHGCAQNEAGHWWKLEARPKIEQPQRNLRVKQTMFMDLKEGNQGPFLLDHPLKLEVRAFPQPLPEVRPDPGTQAAC